VAAINDNGGVVVMYEGGEIYGGVRFEKGKCVTLQEYSRKMKKIWRCRKKFSNFFVHPFVFSTHTSPTFSSYPIFFFTFFLEVWFLRMYSHFSYYYLKFMIFIFSFGFISRQSY